MRTDVDTEGWTDTSSKYEDDHYTFGPTVHTVCVDPDLTDEHVSRLLDQLQFLTAHRDRHQQNIWYKLGDAHIASDWDQRDPYVPVRAEVGSIDNCGSTGCLAGWTVLRSVEIPLVRSASGALYPGHRMFAGTWTTRNTDEAAAEHLGLTRRNRDALFAADNSLGDLWRLAAVITGARITVPEEFRDGPRQHDPVAAELLAYACEDHLR